MVLHSLKLDKEAKEKAASTRKELERRAKMLAQLKNNPEKQRLAFAACTRDCKLWINNFAWGYDPRAGGMVPFRLYDSQEWFIDQIVDAIENAYDIGIEKSRDMGVSWMILLVIQWFFLFRPDKSFLIGSEKEGNIDSNSVDPGTTMFGKLRHNLRQQPLWLVDQDAIKDKHLSMLHNNGNSIKGAAPTVNFGRGGRYTAVLMDELAFWQYGLMAFESCSSVTNCRLVNSTPNGRYGIYGELMTNYDIPREVWPGRLELMKEKEEDFAKKSN